MLGNFNPEGYIYAYQPLHVPNLVKIGVTTRPDKRREEVQNSKCGCKFGKIVEHICKSVSVLLYKKVEELCHAELANYV